MKNNSHDATTRLIALKPQLIGLDNIVLSTGEVHLFNKNGSLYHQPDNLMFDPSTRTLYNCEYKCGDALSKATHQLYETEEVLRKVFKGYEVVNLYIHGNYKVEEI